MVVLKAIAASQDGLVTARQATAAGLTRADIRSLISAGFWKWISRGVYIRAAEPTGRQRVRAAVLSVGPGAAACGTSAATVWGLQGAGDGRPEIAVPASQPRVARRDILVRPLIYNGSQVTSRDDIPVFDLPHTLADLACRLPRMEAVSVLDSALNQDLLRRDQLADIEHIFQRRRGAVAARKYLKECDGRAESPLETRVRLICADGDLAPDELQHPVRLPTGETIGYGDLYWERAKLIGECDGSGPHSNPPALLWDRRRANEFLLAGYRIVRFTWADTENPSYVRRIVSEALNRHEGAA